MTRQILRRLRTALTLVAFATVLTAITSCHTDEDDYTTAISVVIDAPEGISVSQMQGTVTLTNLNNRQTYATSVFAATTATLELMRGVYSVDVEGSVRYVDANGSVKTTNFRAATSYCEALEHPSEVHLDLILM